MIPSVQSFSPNILLFCCTVLLLYQQITGVQQFKDLSGLVGDNIQLPCEVSVERCGEFHSIKWYRGSSRIFVFSDMGSKIARSEGGYVDRAQFRYKENYTTSYLELKELLVTDEAVYKCEITYLEVRENCQVVQFINLTTLIKPKYIKITKGGVDLKNQTTEHMNEDDLIELECESGGGKPIPTVEWWNGTQKMDGNLQIIPESNGIGTARHSHKITLTRGDLSVKYECRAYNDALNFPLLSWLQMDVNVRPYAMEMAEVDRPYQQGQMVNLSCIVRGAKPEATVTWFNGTEVLSREPESDSPPMRERYTGIKQTTHSHGDGTYDTVSTLQFFASRFENDVTFSCEATNPVKELKNEGSLRKEDRIEVFYPPIVQVNASNLIVNETSDILIFCTYEANPATLKSIEWFQDGRPVNINRDHYEGGTIDQTTLTIRNSTRDDNGNYSCELANQVNSSMSHNEVPISVYFKPTVRLRIDPIKPIREIDELNATLLCDVESGNPMKLETVRWYLDGKFLKEIPDCSPNSTFCDNNLVINKLILERVTRGFIGNYSCEGKNAAGWGDRSPDAELIVYYPPGAAKLEYEPSRVVKGGMVTLTCSVARHGLPSSTEFHWYRGDDLITQEKGPVWIIHTVTLQTKANFTCQAVNAGGKGQSDTKYIDVYAPPQIINRPNQYTGVLLNSQNVNISCHVECYPLCEIEWYKNHKKMDFRLPEISDRYSVQVNIVPPNLSTNDFESVKSELLWNMNAWPNGQLDPNLDNVNYTCQSSSNEVGQGVKSSTVFGVEYPPEGLRVSKDMVNVTELNMPEKIVCTAKAFPEASYSWAKEDDPNNTLSKTNSLSLNVPVRKAHGGNYVCTATNRHGSNTIKTMLNVLYKPECGISQQQHDGKILLTCIASGNPAEIEFKWNVKDNNETITEGVVKYGNRSELTLEWSSGNIQTYQCHASNSVGTSIPCELDVTGSGPWWAALLENDHLIIFLAIVIGLIILVIIICVIIIIICRRKRTADKYNSTVELEDRQNCTRLLMSHYEHSSDLCPSPGQTQLNTSGGQGGKWPLRPGVLVHVNTNHSLLSHQSPPGSPTKSLSSEGLALDKRKKPTNSGDKRSTPSFLSSTFSVEAVTQPSRAAKIKSMFSGSGKYHGESNGTLPGVFNKSGGPANKDKNELSSSPNDALLQPDGDKVFYENLPFHGMQNPPNKNNKYASSRSLDRRYNGGPNHYPAGVNHYAHHNGRSSSSTMHRNYSAASRQDECILQAPYAPPPYLNHNGYSDLQMTHRPLQRPVVNPPYYQDYAAVIKFHDVGKEIDV
uniref:Hemicentin-2 n=1 Tax=Cacopsylla melanoneura TaxID=428564 RepID=A0A8D8UIM3_9HEMI